MYTVQLNQTGDEISALGIGAMHLSLSGRPAESQSIEVLHRAFDLGVTFIDTADSYCVDESDKHHNERLIQKAIESYDGSTEDLIVATKGGLMRPNGAWKRNGDPDHIRKAIETSYEILHEDDPITLWQLHAPDPDVPIQTSLEAVAEAQENNLINHVGLSNVSVEQIRKAQNLVDVVSVQNEYHPWQRNPEENGVLSLCEEEHITFLPYRPLGGRHRAGELSDLSSIEELAAVYDVSPHQIVLAWHRHQSDCIVPIPGVSRQETLEDSVASVQVDLTEQDVNKLNASF